MNLIKAVEITKSVLAVALQDYDDPEDTHQRELVEALLLAVISMEFCADLEKNMKSEHTEIIKQWINKKSSLRGIFCISNGK